MASEKTVLAADKWMAQRQVQNLMGRYVNDTMLKRQDILFEKYWCAADKEPVYAANEGWYVGAEAVKGYYDAEFANTEARSRLMKSLFPDYLGKRFSDIELHGVGELPVDALTTPVVEVADDLRTAKGVWYYMGVDSGLYASGPTSFWDYGFFAGDFVCEDGAWKIWHLQRISDMRVPAGKDWSSDWEPYPELPEFASLREQTLPEPTVKQTIREVYTPGRPTSKLVRVPEPYATFSETFSYGI